MCIASEKIFKLFNAVSFSASLEKENRLIEVGLYDEFNRDESHFVYVGIGYSGHQQFTIPLDPPLA